VRSAYLILSYQRPELLVRLVGTLRAESPEAAILVHHDARRCPTPRAELAAHGVRLIEPAAAIEWGHGSQLAAVLRCLDWADRHEAFDWLWLLSGQDYPLRPLGEIEAALASSGVDALIEASPVAALHLRRHRVDEFARRYRYRWRRIPGGLVPLAVRADPLVQVRRLPSGAFAGVPARALAPYHHGSDWFTLSHRAIRAVLDAPRALRDHFAHTIVPTEAYVQTVLANSGLRLSHDTRRYVDFVGAAANPRVLGLADLDAVVASGRDFARKFEDVAVLDALDARVRPSRSVAR
jgi:hypothetical protein